MRTGQSGTGAGLSRYISQFLAGLGSALFLSLKAVFFQLELNHRRRFMGPERCRPEQGGGDQSRAVPERDLTEGLAPSRAVLQPCCMKMELCAE